MLVFGGVSIFGLRPGSTVVYRGQETEEWCYREKLKIDSEWQRLNKLSEERGSRPFHLVEL